MTDSKWEVVEERNTVTGKSRYLVVKGLIALPRRITRRNPIPERALYRSRRKAELVARKLNRVDRIDAGWETP